ncbi:ComF family protein [Gracilibacillus kekensis]|uniref:Competence protein ComFC n=1 Tax=Gracilibacillus kekensis TaxID=1027249 RepID=A0A1M7N096_9BACI|nr:ComF family protein [Gracilibacillus kekensis]SHM96877.1 competence protein ComFC [Gracilibacillus kekensis]
MNCLYCQEVIDQPVTWSTLLHPVHTNHLCQGCRSELQKIADEICNKCGRSSNESLCPDCQQWLNSNDYQSVLIYNRSIYQYTSFMQEVVSQWKYRGDYHLISIFEKDIFEKISELYQSKSLTIVPIPLTRERLYERAFNLSLAIAEIIAMKTKMPIVQALERNSELSEKQSKKSRKERMATKNPFRLTKSLQTDILLVDDIYTTGMTIHHAAKVLKGAGSANIYSFTLIR